MPPIPRKNLDSSKEKTIKGEKKIKENKKPFSSGFVAYIPRIPQVEF